jgi:membrane fusion protein, multidrug efflux system
MSGAMPPVPVALARATQESIPVEVRVVGTVEASAKVEVKSQVAGELLRVAFTEGQNVAKGALLFEIDSRPYQDALRQAEAALARDRAQLKQAEATLARDRAQLEFAESDASRGADLYKAKVISKAQADQTRTTANVARESAMATQASLDTARAAIESDLAAIERAKLDLSYTKITAPIAGHTGNLLVHAGNLVKANDVALVVINQISPVWATFSVPEQHLSAIRRLAARQKLPVRVSVQDDPAHVVTGQLIVIDNTVDANTGAIKLKAVFPNSDGYLWPGQFVNVVMNLDTIANATVVPAEAVQEGQQGRFVYVVKEDKSVEPRQVSTGQIFDRRIVVEKGVNPGETVVTDGHLRLYPGAKVVQVDLKHLEAGKS